MRFEVLGPLRAFDDDGRPCDIRSPSQRSILSVLLASAGRSVPVEALVELLWGGEPPTAALSSLRAQVSRLRRLLGERLASVPNGYLLVLGDGDSLDASELAAAVSRARAEVASPTADGSRVADDLEQVLRRWRGRPFDGLDDPGVRIEAAHLELLHLEGRELSAQLALRDGRYGEVIAAMERLVAEHDLRESGWALLIRALARAGRAPEGVRAAVRAADVLGRAGLVPGSALRQAEAEALGLVEGAHAGPPPPTPAQRRRPRAPLTATIGRAAEQHTVLEVLTRARLVTLVGPGGVGKTRLAIDVARIAADRYAAGVVVVDLAGIPAGDGVAGPVIAALDPVGDRRDADDVLAAAGALELLVVLDNCEHVIGAVAAVARAMLDGGDRLVVLATSREPIDIDGECVVPVAPLPADSPEAAGVALFCERAGMAAPGMALDRERLVRVVQRLDGLPIAIEMAAARLRMMSLAEVEESLEQGLSALTSPRRDVDARQRTVRSLLEWSEALLDPALRDTWFALATFAGPVSAQDVARLIDDPAALDHLARLVDRSLVTVVPQGDRTTYTVLQLVRDFGLERLDQQGRLFTAQHRHARWVQDLVGGIDAELPTEQEPAAFQRFTTSLDEIRQALRWSFEHDVSGAVRILLGVALVCRQSFHPEFPDWARRAAAVVGDGDADAPIVQALLSSALSFTGRLAEARAAGEASLAGAPRGIGALIAVDSLGDVAIYEGRLADAESVYRGQLDLAVERGHATYTATALTGIAIALAYRDRVDEAVRLLEVATSHSVSGSGWLSYARGESLLERDPDAALAWLERAVEAGRLAGNRYLREVALLSSSSIVARTMDPVEGASRFLALLDLHGDAGERKPLLTTLRNVVPVLVRLGRHEPASVLFGAVAEHPLAPTFGPEAARLGAAAAQCEEVLGPGRHRALADLGRALTLEAALDGARSALAAPVPTQLVTASDHGATVAGTPSAGTSSAGTFERRGGLWHLAYRGSTAVVADLKGLGDLATLLSRPGEDVHVLQLVGGADVAPASDPLIDERARAEYRRHMAHLRQVIERARERGDARRAERAEDELDALVAQLSAGLGLGGRPRAGGSSHERARTTVTHRIRVALAKVDVAHPELGRHLRHSVRTGTWCSYRPEHETRWTVVAT